MTITQFLEANGIFFTAVFGIMSLTAVALIVWRFIKNWRQFDDVDRFAAEVEQVLQSAGGRGAVEYCERQSVETDSAAAQLFHAALSEGRNGKLAARDAMADSIDTEIMPALHSLLPYILLLAKISPMVGLFGTVCGMIGAFQTIAGATKVDPGALANDIGMALFTTAEGLLIAIPLIFFYTIFRERVNQYEPKLQHGSQLALKLLPKIYRKQAA